MNTPEVTGFVDITPTPEGFARMAAALAFSIASDVPTHRIGAVREQLDTIIEIAAFLAIKDPAALDNLRRRIAPVVITLKEIAS